MTQITDTRHYYYSSYRDKKNYYEQSHTNKLDNRFNGQSPRKRQTNRTNSKKNCTFWMTYIRSEEVKLIIKSSLQRNTQGCMASVLNCTV